MGKCGRLPGVTPSFIDYTQNLSDCYFQLIFMPLCSAMNHSYAISFANEMS